MRHDDGLTAVKSNLLRHMERSQYHRAEEAMPAAYTDKAYVTRISMHVNAVSYKP